MKKLYFHLTVGFGWVCLNPAMNTPICDHDVVLCFYFLLSANTILCCEMLLRVTQGVAAGSLVNLATILHLNSIRVSFPKKLHSSFRKLPAQN